MTEIASKSALRAAAIARRALLSPPERAAASEKLAAADLSFLSPRAGSIVSGFSAMPEELDVFPLLERLTGAGCRACLPVMQGKGKPLLFRAWAPGDDLDIAMWGIRQPKAEQPAVDPDILLVPLLAWDAQGWRLGYGGGFYDRTLRGLRARKAIVAVGVAFDGQQVDAVPHLDYDERLDWVLTPGGPRRFAA
jgi:5-formyltetrahydrofolate cyclo-ligase